jgi:uncharacterized membrane protein YtjA (UPF0391 family)
MKRLPVILVVISLIAGLAGMMGCGGMSSKATTPAEVVQNVKVGMTGTEVIGVVDQDYFISNSAFAVVSFSKLEVSGGTITYQVSKDLDSPYYGWLLFGVVVQDLNPALIGFKADGETVMVVARISFDKAQSIVEWQSGRPFRR